MQTGGGPVRFFYDLVYYFTIMIMILVEKVAATILVFFVVKCQISIKTWETKDFVTHSRAFLALEITPTPPTQSQCANVPITQCI